MFVNVINCDVNVGLRYGIFVKRKISFTKTKTINENKIVGRRK